VCSPLAVTLFWLRDSMMGKLLSQNHRTVTALYLKYDLLIFSFRLSNLSKAISFTR
jgi:hypothetical protein